MKQALLVVSLFSLLCTLPCASDTVLAKKWIASGQEDEGTDSMIPLSP
jgi:hypothetical protein